MNIEEFRRYGHALIDWLADYHEGLASKPVQAATRPGEVRVMMPAEPPENPETFEACIADLDTIVAPHLSHWQHPRFFGYFPANALFAGVLGDLVSTGLGTVGLSWQSSPALSEVEEVVTDWVRRMVDLSPAWVGVISDTASTSTLVAMISARERSRPIMDWRKAVSRPKPGRSWSMRPPAAIHASRRARFLPASGARTSAWFRSTRPRECGRTR